MNKVTIALLALGGLLAGCGDAPGDKWDEPQRQGSPVVEPNSDEAQVQREADENRKQFLGDGKSKYTPQRVDGF